MARNNDIGAQLRHQFTSKTTKNSTEIKQSDAGTAKEKEMKKEEIPSEQKKLITIPVGGRPRLGTETRSRKLTVLLTPSLYEDVKNTAYQKRVSVNEFIFNLLEQNVNH